MQGISYSSSKQCVIALVVAASLVAATLADNFYNDVDITFGNQNVKILNGGQDLTLSLDQYTGSGFRTKHQYLFGRFDMQLKLIPGDSVDTVTTFYLQAQGDQHDEIDFEFLGSSLNKPYMLSTNIFTQGKGDREQQFHLWFDPTAAFHTYTIIWNSHRIILFVDNIPIRVFHNYEAYGIQYPKNQPMWVYASLWNNSDWASQGSRETIDWSKAPFTASYRNLIVNGNIAVANNPRFTNSANDNNQTWINLGLDAAGRKLLRWVQKEYLVYNYCDDYKRFPNGLPKECKKSRFL
uniref:xyloglucan endotransglucosylase/hydrolase protein 24-like n=1 Tax=Erigeron canadensis TaxID=72917 RepID=UPI001CB89C4D|nr:xyloglucan endotransglucosylase/hydrolase protein 24-like [Erigeron canadensis]